MPSIEYRPDRPKAWRAIYWGPDGKRHSRSFARESDAKRWLTSEEAAKLQGTWADPNQGRRRFNDWADEWWAVWSSDPGRSPKTLEAAESHLRLHIRSHFGARQLRTITVHAVQQWQNELAAKASYNLTMACRSLLNRILQAATDNRLIPFNPVAKVRPPKRPVDPEVIFGRVRPRTYSPEELGQFLAACPSFYRDHFLTQVATGLRSGELLGLRQRRVDLARRRIEVIDVRYDAGRYGSGYKNRPKSNASIRVVPLAEPVMEAVSRRLVGCPARRAGLQRAWWKQQHQARRAVQAVDPELPPGLQGGGRDRCPPPSRPSRATRPAPHLRDLAGGRRHPQPSDRRADGPPGRSTRRARQPDGDGLPAHDPRDAGPRGRGHRGPLGHRRESCPPHIPQEGAAAMAAILGFGTRAG